MNTQYLKTFINLTETKSFTATAKKLNMTQPGVTQHLKHLEDYYGIVLIERKGKFFRVTEAGDKLLVYCRKLFAEHEKLREEISLDEPTKGACMIASPGSFGIKLYSTLLELNKKYPLLNFYFTVAPNQSIVQGVLAEKYPLAYISVDIDDPGINKKKISNEKLLLVAPKKVKIATYDDIVNCGFIAHPDGYLHASRLLSENFPKQYRSVHDFPVRGFVNQINRILDPVACGLGFTVLPEHAVAAFPKQDEIQIIELPKQVFDPIFMINKKHVMLPKRYLFVIDRIYNASICQ